MFPIKNCLKKLDALPLLLFKFFLNVSLEVSVKQEGLNLNGTHQILLYAGDVNILGGSRHTLRKNTGDLVVASKQTGMEGNADETKYRSYLEVRM
jgi:hypothetical protein